MFAVLVIAPFVVNDYLLTVLIVTLYFAYTGQAWNIMMGFAGQLSLGHAIYAGLGGYVRRCLFTRYGVAPWLGVPGGHSGRRGAAARSSAFSRSASASPASISRS